MNRTLHFEETRKRPNLLQRLLADDVMKKRWRLSNEQEFFRPYEASDETAFDSKYADD